MVDKKGSKPRKPKVPVARTPPHLRTNVARNRKWTNGYGAPEGVAHVLTKAGFTRDMVERKTADILLMTAAETHEFENDAETCNFDLIVCSVVKAAIRTADCGRLDNLLEKIFGKTVRIEGKVDVSHTDNTPMQNADAALIQRALERALRNNS